MTATVAELAPTVEAAAMACQQIIGSTVLSGMSDPCRVLAPEDMVLASDTTVWRHVVELDRNHQPVTLPALMALAQQDGAVSRYPDGGGEGWHRPYVHAAEETPTSTIPQLVAIIRAASARRQIERDALDIASAARAGRPVIELVDDVARLAAWSRAATVTTDAPLSRRASMFCCEPVTWIIDGVLAVGEPMGIVGAAGLGKSTWSDDVAARVSTGRPQYGSRFARPAADVLIYDVENSIAHVTKAKLEAAGADQDRIYFWPEDLPLQFPRDVDLLLGELKKLPKPELVIFDPLISTLQSGLNANTDADIRRAFTPLFAALRALGVASISIRHPNKKQGVSATDKASGSPATTALLRTEFYLGHADEDPSTITMACAKTNLGKMPQAIQFRLVEVNESVRLEYIGRSDTTANDLVADPMVRAARASAKSDAIEKIILDMGADGKWHSSVELEHAVKKAGGSISTIKRVKKDLGVKSARQRQPPRAWYWYLPSGAYPAPKPLEAHLREVSGAPDESLHPDETLSADEPLQTPDINYLEGPNTQRLISFDTPPNDEPLPGKSADEPLPSEDAI